MMRNLTFACALSRVQLAPWKRAPCLYSPVAGASAFRTRATRPEPPWLHRTKVIRRWPVGYGTRCHPQRRGFLTWMLKLKEKLWRPGKQSSSEEPEEEEEEGEGEEGKESVGPAKDATATDPLADPEPDAASGEQLPPEGGIPLEVDLRPEGGLPPEAELHSEALGYLPVFEGSLHAENPAQLPLTESPRPEVAPYFVPPKINIKERDSPEGPDPLDYGGLFREDGFLVQKRKQAGAESTYDDPGFFEKQVVYEDPNFLEDHTPPESLQHPGERTLPETPTLLEASNPSKGQTLVAGQHISQDSDCLETLVHSEYVALVDEASLLERNVPSEDADTSVFAHLSQSSNNQEEQLQSFEVHSLEQPPPPVDEEPQYGPPPVSQDLPPAAIIREPILPELGPPERFNWSLARRILGLPSDEEQWFAELDPVFVSLDLEYKALGGAEWEQSPGCVALPVPHQVGLAYLDMRALRSPPAGAADPMREAITVRQLHVDTGDLFNSQDTARLQNRPDSTFARTEEIHYNNLLTTIEESLRIRDDKSETESFRNIILVGQSLEVDVKVLELNNWNLQHSQHVVACMDVCRLSRLAFAPYTVESTDHGRYDLHSLIYRVGISGIMLKDMHTACTDAVFTLYVMVRLAVRLAWLSGCELSPAARRQLDLYRQVSLPAENFIRKQRGQKFSTLGEKRL